MENLFTQQGDDAVRDFLTWLRREYLKRRKKNAQYSVRAFANYLDLASGTVSHLLAGKRKPSPKFVTALMKKLHVTPAERQLILGSLKKTKEPAVSSDTAASDYQQIALDSFKLIADWYHYAILELTAVKGFKSDAAWIASQLGISVTEAHEAIERLLRLDLLEERDGKFVKTESFITNGDDSTTNSALQSLQRHVLQKALDAIDTVSIQEKDISSMTMAIDVTKIPEAKKRITKFRRELCEFLEDGVQTRVFNLGIQLYPVSKGSKK